MDLAFSSDSRSPPAGPRRHGGRLAEAALRYPDAPRPWLDLSTGVNPRPWRGARASASALKALPDPLDLAALEQAAAAAFGVSDPSRVVAMAGAEAALRWAPMLLDARTVDVVGPTYGGHEAAARAAGAAVREITPEMLETSDADLRVVVNPNNPDGRRLSPDAVARLAERPGWLLIDESFVETEPDLSVALVAWPRLIVLRSFGKFYGLPGVRLGFAISPPAVARRFREAVGDWPVCADALALGRAAYADPAWRERTAARLRRDAARLDAMLSAAGFDVLGGTSLFRLANHANAVEGFERLARLGVLTRPFAGQPNWLRFGLPGAQSDWRRLAGALGA